MFGFLLAVMPGDGSDCWVADCIEDETGEVDTERARSISAPFALLEADAALVIAAMAEETQNPGYAIVKEKKSESVTSPPVATFNLQQTSTKEYKDKVQNVHMALVLICIYW